MKLDQFNQQQLSNTEVKQIKGGDGDIASNPLYNDPNTVGDNPLYGGN